MKVLSAFVFLSLGLGIGSVLSAIAAPATASHAARAANPRHADAITAIAGEVTGGASAAIIEDAP